MSVLSCNILFSDPDHPEEIVGRELLIKDDHVLINPAFNFKKSFSELSEMIQADFYCHFLFPAYFSMFG